MRGAIAIDIMCAKCGGLWRLVGRFKSEAFAKEVLVAMQVSALAPERDSWAPPPGFGSGMDDSTYESHAWTPWGRLLPVTERRFLRPCPSTGSCSMRNTPYKD